VRVQGCMCVSVFAGKPLCLVFCLVCVWERVGEREREREREREHLGVRVSVNDIKPLLVVLPGVCV